MNDHFVTNASRAVWNVGDLLQEVGELLTWRFSACAVRGEIAGFSRAASGHCYFNLKDADGSGALLRCAMFRRAASLLSFSPADGQVVELRGRLGVYGARGELQLVAESMQSAGAGALYEQFLRIRARLEAQGLFGVARKRELPLYPRAVGVVTSLVGAALHDVLATLARRAPQVRVVVYPALVQGASAPGALVEAISRASKRAEVDTLIVCRGGGSLEDLWAFNDEQVVRSIVAASMPVVCGVGHETDVTLADMAADLRAPTPTAAAELVAPTRDACVEVLTAFTSLLQRHVNNALDVRALHLDRTVQRLARPGQVVRAQNQRLALLAHRLETLMPRSTQPQRLRIVQLEARMAGAVGARLTGCAQTLDALAARLRALDPQRVLARGYAWLSDARGRPVSSVQELEIGATVQAVLNDGIADMKVVNVAGRTGA